MRELKVLFAISGIRDGSSWLNELVIGCAKSEFENSIYFLDNQDYPIFLRSWRDSPKIKLYSLKVSKHSGYVWNLFKLLLYLWRDRPHIVHAHGFIASTIVLPIAFLLRIPIRIVDRHHGLSHHIEHHPKAILIDRILNLLSTSVVVHSKPILDNLPLLEKTRAGKVFHVPLGINQDYFTNIDVRLAPRMFGNTVVDENTLVIGFNARAVEWKGIQVALNAVQDLQNTELKLIFVFVNVQEGQELFGKLISLISDNKIIVLKDFSPISNFYRDIDLFCHVPVSELAEPFGLVYIESIVSGVPSCFTISGVLSEISLLPETVSIIPHKSSKALVQAILEYAASFSLHKRHLPQINSQLELYRDQNYAQLQIEMYRKMMRNRQI